MTCCNFFLKVISFQHNFIDQGFFDKFDLQQTEIQKELNPFFSQCCQTQNNRLFRGNNQLFFCSSKTDFEFLIMSRKDSKQMNLNILKEIFKHDYEVEQE